MAFGGGSSGSAALTAHTHNQTLAGDGGDLSETLTDMNGVPLFSLITDNAAAVAANTVNIATNAAAVAANTASITALGTPPFSTESSVNAHKLIRWIAQTEAANNEWSACEYSPTLDQFCSVSGTGSGNRVMTSTNAVLWTSRTSAADNAWYGLAWSEDLDLWAAVGNNTAGGGTNAVMTSSNGTSWTLRSASANYGWNAVCASDGAIAAKFCAVASNGGTAQTVMTSTDGTTWTARTPANTYVWQGIGWNGSDLFVAVASSGGTTDKIMTSPDGITWTARTAPSTTALYDVIYSPTLSLWVACQYNGAMISSPDGITWTARTAVSKGWTSMSWSEDNKIFVAAADSAITYSSDGITWHYVPTPPINPRGTAWSPILEIYASAGSGGCLSSIL
jgi:hypothetical protein